MARYRGKVKDLAMEAGFNEEETYALLKEEGIDAMGRELIIPKKHMARARRILCLPEKPKRFSEIEKKTIRADATVFVQEPVGVAIKQRKLEKWPTIGVIETIKYLAASEVEQIHWAIVDEFNNSSDPIDPPGIRSDALLESAVNRPYTSLGFTSKYPSVVMAGAALVHGLVLNHPFFNGNKRTALVALLIFLDKNHWTLMNVTENELYSLLTDLADHKLTHPEYEHDADREMLEIAGWLHRKIRRRAKSEKFIKWHDLKRLLLEFGCTIDHPKGNKHNIRRGKKKTQINVRNDGHEIEKESIQTIRRDLELDDDHGYDSYIFYTGGKRIPEFMRKYRSLLQRLAKV